MTPPSSPADFPHLIPAGTEKSEIWPTAQNPPDYPKNPEGTPTPQAQHRPVETCPYCKGTKIVKSGLRVKKLERVQVYYCKHCDKKFTPLVTRQKTYPIAVILKAMTYYNRFETAEAVSRRINEEYGFKVSAKTIGNWIKDYKDYLPFLRMRDFLMSKPRPRGKHLKASDCIMESRLFHGQIYDFKYHHAKLDLILNEDIKNRPFGPLRDFLQKVVGQCPHHLFQDSRRRASQHKDVFDLTQVRITPKINAATRSALFVIQAVANNKLRHQTLQEFMLVNDSVTVAVEIPIVLGRKDILHLTDALHFHVPLELKEGEAITGHVDLIQVRNGMIHIMDYKPGAKRVKAVEQLTIYALALSRLTGLRLYHFKCAWFDEKDYFEFYPLHVVYKKPVAKPGWINTRR